MLKSGRFSNPACPLTWVTPCYALESSPFAQSSDGTQPPLFSPPRPGEMQEGDLSTGFVWLRLRRIGRFVVKG
jgi:hypothetical protein